MTDIEVMEKWNELGDIPFDESAESQSGLVLSVDWWIFPKGTDCHAIWEYFDSIYSQGVYSLLYH